MGLVPEYSPFIFGAFLDRQMDPFIFSHILEYCLSGLFFLNILVNFSGRGY